MKKNPLLQVKNLKCYFYTDEGIVKAIDGVDFFIDRRETLGMVGESGCGKSVTALSILQLIQSPPGKIVDGKILFKGKDLLESSNAYIRKIRGNDISMIFQEPMTSLNPVFTIGDQIAETIALHQNLSSKKAMSKTVEWLKIVGIPNPKKRVNNYPHELSGGQRQRVMIAMALSCNPDLLIADEPTTALDVTIQAQILELVKKLKNEIGMAILMITHNLGVVAEVADNVVVLYAGKAMEYADCRSIFKKPKHPYTMALMKSIPRLTDKPGEKLEVIKGSIPDPLTLPSGCKFHPRCKYVKDICIKEGPELENIGNNHFVRCWMHSKDKVKYFGKAEIIKTGKK